jgi:integrase/recombinase XerD
MARSVRVIGKGNKERAVPLPDAFGQVFGYWISDKGKDEFVFAKESGGKPPGPPAARAYLRRLVEKTGIDKKVTPHKLRHTYATRLLESGAELIDIQVLLGHVNLATTQIYTHVSEERMAGVVSKL